MAADNTDDLTNYELAYQQALAHVKQLEAANVTLKVEIDRMQPIVTAAIDMKEHGCGQCEAQLDLAVMAYEQSMAQSAKGEGG